MDVLVLGARGALGRLVCEELVARGHRTRTVSRPEARDAGALAAAARGAAAIINCAGASMQLGLGHGWRGYRAVDTPIGLAAVAAARQVGARLVYVGVHHTPAMARCAYIDAHEQVVRAMADLDGVVVRATGFFSAFASFLPLARRGLLVDVGRGRTRTNPIDEHDLAAIVAESAFGDGPREIAAGGPQVMTRAEVFETVIAAANRRVRVLRLPVWLGDASAALMRIVHPRMGQLGRFAAQLARHDVIAPALGTRTLSEYFAAEQPRAMLRSA